MAPDRTIIAMNQQSRSQLAEDENAAVALFRTLRGAMIGAFLLGGASSLGGCDARGVAAAEGPAANTAKSAAAAESRTSPNDRPVEAWRLDLLDLAFGAAGAVPTDPHIKTRCRLQEDCVGAALRLHQPARAARYAAAILDWRRATALGDCALYAVENGAPADALRLADESASVAAEHAARENAQEWQRDRAMAKISRVKLRLGLTDDARKAAQNLSPSEAGSVREEEAGRLDVAAAAAELGALEDLLRKADLDLARGALGSVVRIYERCFADAAVRERAAELVRTGFAKLPPDVRVGLLLDLSAAAVRKGDVSAAKASIDRAKQVVDAERWLHVDHIKLFSRLATARAEAGDAIGARHEAGIGAGVFVAHRTKIPDFERTDALVPLAAAWAAAGDLATALKTYRMSAEEGRSNPNARTRVEDLTAVALSLATGPVAPDADLRAFLQSTREGLAAPW